MAGATVTAVALAPFGNVPLPLVGDQPVHGKNAGVFVAQFDLSGDFTGYNFGKNRQNPDVTTMGNDDRVLLAGLRDGSMSVQGVFNNATDKSDEEFAALDGVETVFTASPTAASAIGDRAHMVNGFIDNYQPRSSITDAVRFSSGITASAGAYLGQIIHHNNQESSVGDSASINYGATTTTGATAFIHVTQFSGTDATITVEDATTEPTYGSLVAFTQVTGLTSEKVEVTGEVLKFVRVALTGTFTTITFVVSFSRTLA